MAQSAPLYIVSAFTTDPFGGNPAAVVFVEPDASGSLDAHNASISGIAKTLNQPMLAAISNRAISENPDPKVEVRSIAFYLYTGKGLALCGHATVAASHLVFALPEIVERGVTTIEWRTAFGGVVKAYKDEDGAIAVELDVAKPVDITDENEKGRLKGLLDSAFGRDLKIRELKGGGEKYPWFLLVDIDESEDLANAVIDHTKLLTSGWNCHVITSASSSGPESFVLRMFAPASIPGGEDPVCGVAHALLAPHWYPKLGILSGKEIRSKQVSKRGGDLKVILDEERGIVRIAGQNVVVVSGEVKL